MDGLLFLAGLLAIVVVIFWAIVNDKVGMFGRTSGLLAMRRPPAGEGDAELTAADERPEQGRRPPKRSRSSYGRPAPPSREN